MNRMTRPSLEELKEYFAERRYNFVNAAGMQFTQNQHGIHTEFILFGDEAPYKMEIITEEESAASFIEGFQIAELSDIDRLGYNNSWMRYLNGYAEILITPMELEAAFSFRIYKSRTTVSSLELHFYDEAYEHLTLPEDFERYLEKKDHLLQEAAFGKTRYW